MIHNKENHQVLHLIQHRKKLLLMLKVKIKQKLLLFNLMESQIKLVQQTKLISLSKKPSKYPMLLLQDRKIEKVNGMLSIALTLLELQPKLKTRD